VSIVVPTLNGLSTLPDLLARLRGQQAKVEVEIIAVDSGSTDGTTDLLRTQVDRLIEIAPHQFNHGLTRNLGIEAARGELIVLLVQDAAPASPTWLDRLIAPFSTDEWLAGTFARQLPRPGASALTRRALSQWVAASEVPRTISVQGRAAFEGLAPMDRFLTCVFDNVCACVRRSVWRHHPFRETPIAEDLQWAKEVLLAGYSLGYVPEAAVFHSHERGAAYELRRTCLVHERLKQLFELQTIPSTGQLARSVASCLLTHARCVAADPTERAFSTQMARALALAVAWPLGQYLGALSAERGWQLMRGRGV
jgi:rhamnosyltransferase